VAGAGGERRAAWRERQACVPQGQVWHSAREGVAPTARQTSFQPRVTTEHPSRPSKRRPPPLRHRRHEGSRRFIAQNHAANHSEQANRCSRSLLLQIQDIRCAWRRKPRQNASATANRDMLIEYDRHAQPASSAPSRPSRPLLPVFIQMV